MVRNIHVKPVSAERWIETTTWSNDTCDGSVKPVSAERWIETVSPHNYQPSLAVKPVSAERWIETCSLLTAKVVASG